MMSQEHSALLNYAAFSFSEYVHPWIYFSFIFNVIHCFQELILPSLVSYLSLVSKVLNLYLPYMFFQDSSEKCMVLFLDSNSELQRIRMASIEP